MPADMSDDDNIVLETTRRIFSDLADPQEPAGAPGAWRQKLWPALEEAGLTLAWASEASGGAGFSLRDGFEILRLNGQYAAPAPLSETLLAAWALSSAGLECPSGPMTIAAMRKGDRLALDGAGKLSGRIGALPFAAGAEHAVAAVHDASGAEKIVLFTLDAAQLSDRAVDLTGERMDVTLDGVAPLALADAPDGLAGFERIGAAARVQEIAGALESALHFSTEYVQERVAFGRQIGKFQAVQQNLARLAGEVAAALTAASSSADTLASAIEDRDPNTTEDDVFLEVAAAKIRAGEAAEEGAAIAHQAHGAIGFTLEYRLQRYTRALWRWRDDFGSEAAWALRLGQRMTAAGADALWPALTRR